MGQCLIKRAVRALQAEIPTIRQFSTLSPIPGFRSWLLQQLRETERGRQTILTDFDWSEARHIVFPSATPEEQNPLGRLRHYLSDSSWMREDDKARQLMEGPLMRLCAFYLYSEKRRNFALDSVGKLTRKKWRVFTIRKLIFNFGLAANFHLRNGAMMYRLNWAADLSPRGLKNSFGMVNNCFSSRKNEMI